MTKRQIAILQISSHQKTFYQIDMQLIVTHYISFHKNEILQITIHPMINHQFKAD